MRQGPGRLPRDPDTGELTTVAAGSTATDVFRAGSGPRSRLRRQAGVLVAILLGGFLGGALRYVVEQQFPTPVPQFPWTIFAINVAGSFLIVLLLVVVIEARETGPLVRLFWATGFLGAFPTFSTYVLAVVQLVDAGAWATGIGYGGASIVAGLGAAWLGLRCGRVLIPHERQTE